MKTAHLIIKEIMHRKGNFLLSLLAVVTAVALFTAFFTTGEASKRETTRLMRDIGLNLRIIPKELIAKKNETEVTVYFKSGSFGGLLREN